MSYLLKIANNRRHRQSLKQQRGVVIVIALFIVALAATMAYVMMSRLERDTRRTSLLLHYTQANFYAQGSIVWAMDQLRNNWERQKTNKLVDEIPIKSPENVMNGYKISSTIYDMQSRFNLNNLNNDPESQTNFVRLLQAVSPDLSLQKAQEITRATVDWITPLTQENAYSKFYLSLSPAYQTAHRPMMSSSELRLVQGMTPALFHALEPYIVALPSALPINVQTAPAPVLMSLSPNVSLDVAKTIVETRSQTPFTSLQTFFNLDIIKNHQLTMNNVTVTSQYFLVETKVAIEKQTLVLYTLLERVANGNKVLLTILWQSKNIW